MLHITGSTATLKEELRSAQGLLMDMSILLNMVTDETNLSKEIGAFIAKIPDYKVLARDAADAKNTLRKLCTYEVSIASVQRITERAYFEVTALMDALEDFHVTPKK